MEFCDLAQIAENAFQSTDISLVSGRLLNPSNIVSYTETKHLLLLFFTLFPRPGLISGYLLREGF